jgi:hypothetical protein
MNKNNTEKLINYFIEKSNEGQNTIIIPLQKKRKEHDSFVIHPIYKNSKIVAINVEKRVMPGDTIFSIKIFDYILQLLSESVDGLLPKGNALNNKMGEPGLDNNTIEYIIAKEFYNKKDGDSVDRRISVIANILIASGLCVSKSSSLKLNNHKTL